MKHILPFSDLKSSHLMGILLSVLILFSGLTVSAQITSSSIIGNVSDGNNPIPDAVVTILHEPSGIPYYGITNNRGNYVIANVMAGGPYVVRVERLNYKTMIIKDVEVALGEDAIVDVVLTPHPCIWKRSPFLATV